jgi:hypothetical protein
MIKLKTPAFLAISEDMQTSKKVSTLHVKYEERLESKQVIDTPEVEEVRNDEGEITTQYQAATYKSVPQGMVGSWLMDETNNNIMTVQKVQEDTELRGKDILVELTLQYIAQLQELNPSIEFENTLIK